MSGDQIKQNLLLEIQLLYLQTIINKNIIAQMDDYSELTAHYIQQRFKLPKIAAKKIQQANRFINDPNSVIKLIQEKKSQSQQTEEKNKQNPQLIKIQHHQKKVSLPQQQVTLPPERHLISIKMKKFRPVNGSFSQFYGEQLSIDTNRVKRMEQKNSLNDLENSKLTLYKKKSGKKLKNYLKNTVSTEAIDNSLIHYKELPYLVKLKEIRDTSGLLRQNSRHLLQKADSVSHFSEVNYQKLKEQSVRILTGEQKYNFNEQLNPTNFGNGARGHKRWKSRK